MKIFAVGRRKGSLSLSIESIVILIIAITMLGLGLGFVKTMFGKATKNIDDLASQIPDPTPPDDQLQLTISPETQLSVKAGDSAVMKVRVYNPLDTEQTITPGIDCTASSLGATVQANAKIVAAAKSEIYNILVEVPRSELEGSYLCFIKADIAATTTADLSIVVTK
ncbi:MAG: hypothetical protein V1735_06515 [Nanoarchaeota archaeon]